MTNFSISAPAARDLDEIFKHLSETAPDLAKRLYNGLSSTIEDIKSSPTQGAPGRLPGTREIHVRETPYTIVYNWTGDTAVIVALLHMSRDPIKPPDGPIHNRR